MLQNFGEYLPTINFPNDINDTCQGDTCFKTTNAGEHEITLMGKKIGKVNMSSWANEDRHNKSFKRGY